jgi:hypothetical protein
MPSLTRNIPHGSDQERYILKEIQARVRFWERISASKFKKWKDAEEQVLAFMPEREVDAARRATREGGLPQYTTIEIPYTYAVVMAAHTYLASVFMGRDPVFQFTGRHGEAQQQVQALEALISYQVLVGGMLKYIYTWLYDSLKYGEGVVGLWWDEQINTFTNIETAQPEVDPITGTPLGKPQKQQTSERVRSYSGNTIYNVQPQSFIWDVRYTAREFQKGEFAGERRKLGWNDIVKRKKLGYYMNTEFILRGTGKDWLGTDLGSSHLERPELYTNIGRDDGEMQNARHPTMVGIFQLCIELIPNEDWKLSPSDFPEKWVFTCTDDFTCLIGASPLGARHCKFPYSLIPLEPEGYGLTARGMPELLQPIQNTIDWLVNTHFYNVRASLNDRIIVDPSRVVMKDVLDPLPGKVIRLKPEAYGSDPKLVASQMPTSNVTQNHMTTDLQAMFGFGERTVGVNDQIMGMLASGGRRTATEVRTSTSLGINRMKVIAEFASTTGFDPLSMMLVQNSQQYYDMELKFQIVGDLMQNAGPSFVNVTPDLIQGFYNFVPIDGSLPIDRQGQVQLWEQLMGTAMNNPQIGMGYDWAGIFQWVAQLAGLRNITRFKINIKPDDILRMQMQQGNSVPLGPKGPRPNGNMPGVQHMAGMPGAPGALAGLMGA